MHVVWRLGDEMTRHLPLLPCLLGLALCVWRPEWVSVAVLAPCLMFAMYLDNRGRRSDDVEDLEQALEDAQALWLRREETRAADDAGAIVMRKKAADDVEALRHDMKTLRGDMEAIRVALGTAPGRARL